MRILLNDRFAAIAPRFSGFTSAVASSCIIYLIARSKVKLSSIYHRIMFGMSIADVIGSVAMGLTVLPMPKEYEYPYAGTRLGNKQTCQAQGFCIIAGTYVMFNYNVSLCIYYACAIALRLNDKFIAKYLEPFYHLYPVALGLTSAIIPLVADLYHPTKGWDPWCTIDISIRNKPMIRHVITGVVMTILSSVIISFVMITWRVMTTDVLLKSSFQRIARRGRLSFNKVQKSHGNTKVILFQALVYISALMITLTPAILRIVAEDSVQLWVARLHVVLMPLQGCFNLLIFVSHKIHNYRRLHQDVSRCEVLRLLFRGSLTEPVVLSRISIVERYQREEREYIDIYFEDEEHNVEQLRFALNMNLSDNDEENNIFSENEGAEVTADRNNRTIENLCSSSFSDQVKSADGARNSSNDSDIMCVSNSRSGLSGFSSKLSGLINDGDNTNHSNDSDTMGISNSRGGLSGFSSKLSGLINDGDNTNHDGEKGTKKKVTSHDDDSSLLSNQSCDRFNVSMDGVRFSPSSTHQQDKEERSMSQDNKKPSAIVGVIEEEDTATPDLKYNLPIRKKGLYRFMLKR